MTFLWRWRWGIPILAIAAFGLFSGCNMLDANGMDACREMCAPKSVERLGTFDCVCAK